MEVKMSTYVRVPQNELNKLYKIEKARVASLWKFATNNTEMTVSQIYDLQNITAVIWRIANRKWKPIN